MFFWFEIRQIDKKPNIIIKWLFLFLLVSTLELKLLILTPIALIFFILKINLLLQEAIGLTQRPFQQV